MKSTNIVIGLLALAIAGFLYYLSVRLPSPPLLGRGGLGPANYPILLALLLAGLGVLLIIKEGILYRPEPAEEPPFAISRVALGRIVGVGALFVAYVLLLQWLGYFVTTALFIAATIWFLGRYNLGLIALVALAITGILWGIFRAWLGVPLPQGPWGL